VLMFVVNSWKFTASPAGVVQPAATAAAS